MRGIRFSVLADGIMDKLNILAKKSSHMKYFTISINERENLKQKKKYVEQIE